MKRCVVMALLALVLVTGAQATMLLGRNGVTLKPFQVFGWLNMGINQWAKVYDWDDGKYVGLGEIEPRSNTLVDANFMLGLPGKLEVGFDAPLAIKKQGTFNSSGMGDLMVLARYGLLQAKISPVKAALVLGANLPTAKKGALPPLGDRTTDIGLGLSLVTSKLGPLVGHARAAYWFNGKTDSTTKVGNMVEYMLVADYYATPKVIPELALSGFMQGQTQYDGTAAAHTEVSQHVLNVLLLTKPLPFLVVRPKVAFPLYGLSKGSYFPNIYLGLDVWATIP
jgi:hypothetical protein